MPKTNIGRDFLFSEYCGFIKGDENGTSHKYADESGYYYGDDGSEAGELIVGADSLPLCPGRILINCFKYFGYRN